MHFFLIGEIPNKNDPYQSASNWLNHPQNESHLMIPEHTSKPFFHPRDVGSRLQRPWNNLHVSPLAMRRFGGVPCGISREAGAARCDVQMGFVVLCAVFCLFSFFFQAVKFIERLRESVLGGSCMGTLTVCRIEETNLKQDNFCHVCFVC